MGTALYRSYRSRSFDEIVGQEHITQTLKNSLKSKTYAHAYLLTGPRGVGKTSVARILAHAVNDVEYPPEVPEVDIIEIDAASNRRIDEIRELRERIAIAPTRLKYKVYIIDEVHMLTREAFNALLKTLEEPPKHAIFILATTDVHKVPDTIVSRCLRFHFKPINTVSIASQLRKVAKAEKIEVDQGSLELIAEASDGSLRDAISQLDQIRGASAKLDADTTRSLLGMGSADLIDSCVAAITSGDPQGILRIVSTAEQDGVRTRSIAGQLIKAFRIRLEQGDQFEGKSRAVVLLMDSLNAASKQDEARALEIALLKAAVEFQSPQENKPELAPKSTTKAETTAPPTNPVEMIEPVIELPANDFVDSGPAASTADTETWDKVLVKLKDNNKSLYGVVRMADVTSTADRITLSFQFPFHYKQVSLAKNKRTVESYIKEAQPTIVNIEIKLSENKATQNSDNNDMTNITNIFGSSEVLES